MSRRDPFRRLAMGVLAVALATARFAAAQTFSATGSMLTARDSHTATLLGNGKVLIVGGENSSADPLASAELYNPTTGTFAATGSLANARYLHTATLLPNGKVLVLGGFNADGSMASAEVYDPASGLFTSAGVMISPRAMHSATPLSNGKVLIAAGFGWESVVNTAEIYDPSTGSFTLTAGNLSAARYKQTATLLNNGKVLLAGGNGATGPLASAELYDPATGLFASTSPMAFARYEHTATTSGNKVLVAGGFNNVSVLASAELFDPATGSFTAAGPLAKARIAHSAAVAGGQPIILGGLGPGPLVQAELFDAAGNSFSLTGSMLTPRYYTTATTLPNGKVLVAGGYSAGPLASAELFSSPVTTPAPTITFTASPTGILLGQSATLTWNSSNASTVTIDGAPVAVNGSLSVSPAATTLYHLVATGAGGSAQADVTVTVTIPPQAPTVTFTANHSTIQQGQSATLTWDSTHADTVMINGSSFPVDGSMSVTPSATTTYNLAASGPGGTAQASLTVAVTTPSPAVVIDVKPDDAVNSINTKSNGKIPVAILSSASFDATKVDIPTLTFGHSGDENSLAFCAVQRVNAGNLPDLLCHFDTQTAAFQAGDTTAMLKGKTTSGVAFEATDSISIVNK